jgi:hypothetical protein
MSFYKYKNIFIHIPPHSNLKVFEIFYIVAFTLYQIQLEGQWVGSGWIMVGSYYFIIFFDPIQLYLGQKILIYT